MKQLFEIHTNVVGESYVRAYAWADTQEEAIALFKKRNPEMTDKIRKVLTLMYAGAESFCTIACDHGWSNRNAD
jgi:hypothetical protein